MTPSTLQTVFQVVAFSGLVLAALGGLGAYYFGKQAEELRNAAIDRKLVELLPSERVIDMAAVQRLSMMGGVVSLRAHGGGLNVQFIRWPEPLDRVVEHLDDLDGLRAIELSWVGFEGPRAEISSLKPLVALPDLEELALPNSGITDLTPLAALKKLRLLYLHDNQITDLTPLQGLSQLQILSMSGNPVTDLSPLQSNSALRALSISETQVTDLQPLITLPRLTSLELQGPLDQVAPSVSVAEVQRFKQARPDVKVEYYVGEGEWQPP